MGRVRGELRVSHGVSQGGVKGESGVIKRDHFPKLRELHRGGIGLLGAWASGVL